MVSKFHNILLNWCIALFSFVVSFLMKGGTFVVSFLMKGGTFVVSFLMKGGTLFILGKASQPLVESKLIPLRILFTHRV